MLVWADPLPGHPCLAFVWPLIPLIRPFVRANPHYSVTLVWPSFGIRSRSFVPARLFDFRLGSFVLVRALLGLGGGLCVLASCLSLYQKQS